MKHPITAFLFLVLASCGQDKNTKIFEKEQLYKGYSTDGNDLCYLKIFPDNSVIFTHQTPGNFNYGEYSGSIRAINDTLFRVTCELTFGQFVCKASGLDTLEIFVDPPALINKKSILVQYENEELMSNPKIDKSGIYFPFDDRLFNERTPAYILTDHAHPITKEALTIKASFGSAYDFISGYDLELDIVISGDSLYTVREKADLLTGPFKLKRHGR